MKLFLTLFVLLTIESTIFAQSDSFCAYVNRGSFSGKLTSFTWWKKDVLAIVIGTRIYTIKVDLKKDINQLNALETDYVYFEDKTIKKWLSGTVTGYYIVSPLNLVDVMKLATSYDELVIVQEVLNRANDERFDPFYTFKFWKPQYAKKDNQLLYSHWQFRPPPSPALVHDTDQNEVWGWMAKYKRADHQTSFYQLQLKGDRWGYNQNAEDNNYLVTFSKNHFVLHRNPQSVPLRASPFDMNPEGFVFRQSGTMFLFDDEMGCVYSIFGWNRTDLYSSHASGETTLKFKARGTPYEQFFLCPANYKPNDFLDPNRCSLADELKRSKSDGRFSGRAGGNEKEQESKTLRFLLIGGAIVLLLVVAVMSFKYLKSAKTFIPGPKSGKSSLGSNKSKQSSSGPSSVATASKLNAAK